MADVAQRVGEHARRNVGARDHFPMSWGPLNNHLERAFPLADINGFDPDWAVYSPGTLLIAFAIERAIAEGGREFDFLRGRGQYKYAWP